MVAIGRAAPGDAAEIAAIAENAYQKYVERIGRKPTPMAADFAGHIAGDIVFVAKSNGRIVGYAVLIVKEGVALLDNIAVLETEQGAGIGSRLIATVEEHLKNRGWSEYQLYTNAKMVENLGYYERLGFRRVRHVVEQGFDRIYFEKTL